VNLRHRLTPRLAPACAALTLGLALPLLAGGPGRYLARPEAWFATPEAAAIAANLLSFQSTLGGWPKNVDTTATPFTGDRAALEPTFDNGATTDELRFLARVFSATREPRYRAAFEAGYDYILKAQYPRGGWPQTFPSPANAYPRHVTFNDGTMVRLLEFLRESTRDPHCAFLDPDRRAAARQAFDRGIACILRCQITVDGRLTAWCAQHDALTDEPRPGRTYELVSLSGAESAGIVRLLLSLDDPSPDVVRAVDAAVAWFRAAQINGLRVVQQPDDRAPRGQDKIVVADPAAPPLWARFYEIPSGRPLFVDRDGVPRYRLADIGYERRNGYAWYGEWGRDLLARDYPAWQARRGVRP
jgi:pectate lyase